jgi:peptidoglycan/xylan/chitin deacetylase (PgdA/CDA1 family)
MEMELRNFIDERIRKNRQEFLGLLRGYYPDFVFSRKEPAVRNIPVFHFHSVRGPSFERKIRFLHENGYASMTADEFLERSSSGQIGGSVLLTFDDGLLSLKEAALPVLQKYGMKAVCFLIPGLMKESFQSQPESPAPKTSRERLLTWEEVTQIHRSGNVDFQSHSLYHESIFVGDRLTDFFHPGLDASFGYSDVPRIGGSPMGPDRKVEYGTPLYIHSSRFSDRVQFREDDGVRERCTRFVADRGGPEFFANGAWRKELKRVHDQARGTGPGGRFETEREREEAIRIDFEESRRIIGERLKKNVSHFCYPWYDGSSLAMDLSRQAGYKTNFWGVLPRGTADRSPFLLSRLPDQYVERLPGRGRRGLVSLLLETYLPGMRKGTGG